MKIQETNGKKMDREFSEDIQFFGWVFSGIMDKLRLEPGDFLRISVFPGDYRGKCGKGLFFFAVV